jgi:squalene-associated FAD-dependent desaturase
MAASPDAPIVVLGGGLAGLAAATRLAEAGLPVTLVEGRGSLGGRARSYRHAATGDVVDTGQHVLMGCYAEMLRFLERVGARDLVRLQPRLLVALAARGGRRERLACPAWPSPLHLAAGLLMHGGLTLADAARCVRVIGDARARWDDPALERVTVAEWLDALGQSAAARRWLWDPITLACLNASPERTAAALLAVVLQRAFLSGGDGSSIGLATVGLSELYVAQAARHVEERGGRLVLNEPARALLVERGRCVGVEGRDRRIVRGAAVVSAVPAPALHRLLPTSLQGRAPFSGLTRFSPSPIVSLHLWLDRRILDTAFVGFVDTQLHWAFDRALTWGRAASGGDLVTLVCSGADDLAAADRHEVRDRLWQELVSCLPEAAAARVLHFEVVKERGATFRAVPGLARHRFGPGTPLPGLLVAGDWTDTGLPATMEGACASGHAAAERLLATGIG